MKKFSFWLKLKPKVKEKTNYEKRVEEIANPSLKDRFFSFINTLEPLELKKKGITKEDVMRIDAELELEAREKADGKDADSEEQKYLEKIKNSNLIFKQIIVPIDEGVYAWFTDSIKGDIKGQNIYVKYKYLMALDNTKPDGIKKLDRGESYNGLLDKKYLAEKETKQIFDEYSQIAKNRMTAINKFIAETKNIKNQDIK